MPLYKIEWKKSAVKELKKLDKKIIPRIINAVELLSESPIPNKCKKLIGSEHIYRIRIGDYRIIYSIENNLLLIEIIRIGHRKDIYKKNKK